MSNEKIFLKADELFESKNYEQAFATFLVAANAGCTHSMLRVASMYTCGEGVSCNYEKAIEWELKAMEYGESGALSIKHLGEVSAGVEDTTSAKVLAWAPAYENYSFLETDGSTEVNVSLDTLPEHEVYMNETFPKALVLLKNLCESKS